MKRSHIVVSGAGVRSTSAPVHADTLHLLSRPLLCVEDLSLLKTSHSRGVDNLCAYVESELIKGRFAAIAAWHRDDDSCWSRDSDYDSKRYVDLHLVKLSVRLDTKSGRILDVW